MKVICVRWGRWASVATKSKIGSCKSAGDYSELPWINRHMSISEWEAHCLLLYFSASYVIQFYMLDNGMLVFFCHWSDHERNICYHHLVYGNSKILWKFKASTLLYYGYVFLLHSSLGSLKQFLMFLEV